ncbi:unnamed protein product [Gadus morhua 'NCC']
MMRVDQEPVLWPGHMGLQVGGQRSEPVLWPGHMGLQVGGQSPSSGRVTWGSRWSRVKRQHRHQRHNT